MAAANIIGNERRSVASKRVFPKPRSTRVSPGASLHRVIVCALHMYSACGEV